MEPATRQTTNHSTKSVIERELIVSLDNDGPLVGPLMESVSIDRRPNEQDCATAAGSDITVLDTVHDTTSLPRLRWWCCWRQAADTTDPHTFSSAKKAMILTIVAVAGSISPVASTIYFPALVTMQKDFATSDTAMNASLSVFTFLTAFFPLLWATFGDAFGRRRIYLISFLISVVGSVCCALSINVTMFIVFRGFSAVGSSSVMSMGAGTLADIFEPHERGKAFAWYTCGPLLGPALGPIIGGYLTEGLGWRSNFWFLAIFAFCIWAAILFLLPETWRPANASTETVGVLPTSEKSVIVKPKRRWINPLAALRLFRFPNIALVVSYIGILFIMLYLVNTTFTRTYTIQYHLSTGTVGLCYLPMAIGCIIGGIAGGRFSDRLYNKRVAQSDEEPYPEMRLGGLPFYGAACLQLLAFVAYGWCVQENVHWAIGLVCQFFLGIALMLPNVVMSTYMVDCFRKQGASVTACNNFVRYIMAGIGSLVSSDLQNALGNGPLFTICGGILFLAFSTIIIVKKKSATWIQLRKEQDS